MSIHRSSGAVGVELFQTMLRKNQPHPRTRAQFKRIFIVKFVLMTLRTRCVCAKPQWKDTMSEECMEHALNPNEVDVGTVLPSEEDSSDVEVSDTDVPDYHPDDHLALPLSMSKWLFRVSWLSASTCLLAVYMQLLDLALVPAAVLFTSINYWRWPDYSWSLHLSVCFCDWRYTQFLVHAILQTSVRKRLSCQKVHTSSVN